MLAHRSARFLIQYETTWSKYDPPSVVSAGRRWLEQSYAALAPFVLSESYQNWPDPALADVETYHFAREGRHHAHPVALCCHLDPLFEKLS